MTHPKTRPARDPGLAPLVAAFYEQAPATLRSGLLSALLRALGPLALVAVAAGAFSRLLPPRPSLPLEVTPEVLDTISGEQVLELARYVEQKSPELLAALPDTVGHPQAWMATAGGTLLLVALQAARGARRG